MSLVTPGAAGCCSGAGAAGAASGGFPPPRPGAVTSTLVVQAATSSSAAVIITTSRPVLIRFHLNYRLGEERGVSYKCCPWFLRQGHVNTDINTGLVLTS